MERIGGMSVLKTLNVPTVVSRCEAGCLDCISPHGMQTLAGTPQKLSMLELKHLTQDQNLCL